MSRPLTDQLFRRKRLWQGLLLILLGGVVLFGLLPLHSRGERLLRQFKMTFVTRDIGLAISGGAALVYLVFSFINWRCPACRRLLWFGLFASKCKGCEAGFKKGEGAEIESAEQEAATEQKEHEEPVEHEAVDTMNDEPDAAPVANGAPALAPVVEPSPEPVNEAAAATLPPIEQPERFERRRPENQKRSVDIDSPELTDEQEALLRNSHKLVRCKSCPRCGSSSYRKKRPDVVLPLIRIRECRNCNQQYQRPTPKKISLALILIGGGAMTPWLLELQNYFSVNEWLKNTWHWGILGTVGLVLVLVGLKKMFLQRKVQPPVRQHGRRRGDIQKAYETQNLLLNVSPTPAMAAEPLPSAATKKNDDEHAGESNQQLRARETVGLAVKERETVTAPQSTSSVAAPVADTRQEPEQASTATSTSAPVLNTAHAPNEGSRRLLRAGCVIPAHPLALDVHRQLDERRMRALTRYYLDAGAGGVAVGVHTTQFALRQQPNDMFRHVLEQTMGELFDHEMTHQKSLVKVAGVCGETKQAIDEAELAASLGYDAGLLNLGAMKDAGNEQLIWHCKEIAKAIPVFGFYLAPAVGGRVLDYEFWRRFADIENVVAIKIAAFNRYDTLNVVRAVADAGRAIQPGSDNPEGIALYTGNDDHIVGDLLGEWTFNVNGKDITQHIVGGLLGHWAVWTKAAVDTFESIRKVNQSDNMPLLSTTLDRQVTDMNAAVFDAANGFKGCVPGIHEVLCRQGLLEGAWCLDPNEKLSAGQADEITRVIEAYPHLTDDEFVAANRDKWLR